LIRGLVGFSVKRRVTVFMVSLAVLVFGYVSFSNLTLNLLPEISYPSLTVQTDFPNAAPGEVENLVSEPVEEVVGVLSGLKHLSSVSRAGVSEVTLEFDWDADMDLLAMDIREKLDRLVLPDETENPIVLRYDPALDPVMRLSFSGEGSLTLLRYVAEDKIKEALERIEGVAAAKVKGGEVEEIQVNLIQGKVAAMGLTPAYLGRVLAGSNINSPGGSLKSRTSNYLVRTLNEYDTVAEIGDLVVTPPGRPSVKLKDIATVIRGVKDREEVTRVNGVECVVIELFKEGDANTVLVADAVREALKTLPNNLPKGSNVRVLFDQSRFIKQSIDEVKDALLIGGVLAILILILFLRDFRATLIITTAIPLSVVATFMMMNVLDVSLNIMSLGGLTLGIGMLVDGAIVVLESIHRARERGLGRFAAAVEGTSEVGGAVVASVLTTVAVFFPIVFVEGIAGELFRDQSLTVTFSLVASLLASLSLIPMLASLGSEKTKKKVVAVPKSKDSLGFFSRSYEGLLRGALRFRWVTVLLAALIFAASLQLYPKLGRELIPALTEGEFYFEVSMPEGTALPTTDEVIEKMEKLALADEAVALVYASVGSRTVSGGLSLKTKDENLGQVNVVLENRGDDALEHQVSDRLRTAFSSFPNLDAKLGRPSFFSLKTPIEMLFYGEDLELLKNYTLSLKPKLAEIQGLVDVRASLEDGNPELNVSFDRERLAYLGLTIRDVSETLHDRIEGTVVSRYKEADRLIDIRLRNREVDRDSIGDIENMVVAERNGQPITLKTVALMDSARGPAEIHRIKQARVAILSGDVSGRGLAAVMAEMERVVAENPPPQGIVAEIGGQNEEMKESFDSLMFAMGLAVFLVYLVMAATFENLIHPFIILFTIPLALVGMILGLYLSGLSLSIIALIGAIFLAGVVVNNAIVLVDAINQNRHAGLDKLEAIVAASKTRLRPILMTTLTTVLGLLPMAIGFGEGSELRTPLAVVVSTGLVVSTLLTLLVIPAVYMIVPSKVSTIMEEEELENAISAAISKEAAELNPATEVIS